MKLKSKVLIIIITVTIAATAITGIVFFISNSNKSNRASVDILNERSTSGVPTEDIAAETSTISDKVPEEKIISFLNSFESERVKAFNSNDYSKVSKYLADPSILGEEKKKSMENSGGVKMGCLGISVQKAEKVWDNKYSAYVKENLTTEEESGTNIYGDTYIYEITEQSNGFIISNISEWENPDSDSEEDILPWEDSLKFVGDLLKTDIVKTIKNIDETKMVNSSPDGNKDVINVNYNLVRTNFSNKSGAKEDYLVMINIQRSWWESGAEADFVFVKNGGKFDVQYENLHQYSGKGISTELKDINSDVIMEMVVEEDNSGNQSSADFVTVLMHSGTKFIPVFHEGLFECGGYFPYQYQNEYKFEKNPGNPKLQDIVFKINTIIDESSIDMWKQFGHDPKELPRPFKDTVVFTFDGTKYVPDKEVYDYRGPFKQ